MNAPKVMTVDKIFIKYGYKPTTLKYLRQHPKKNNADVPYWFLVGNRPHYPTDQFEAWHLRQIKKNRKDNSDNSDQKLEDKKDKSDNKDKKSLHRQS